MNLNRPGRVICAVGGVLLLVSLFLPWAGSRGGEERSGWEMLTTGDVVLAIAAVVAILAALTGGRFSVFRPDVTLAGLADMLGVLATVILVWLLAFGFPEGARHEFGAYLALAGAVAATTAAGDFSVPPRRWFARTDGE
ncbi:MAG: hypothetical protein H0U32_05000 [Thermoleophilaceae bacterium]|nr:hypothetical protein [Thermoleophilaceae bacterium]